MYDSVIQILSRQAVEYNDIYVILYPIGLLKERAWFSVGQPLFGGEGRLTITSSPSTFLLNLITDV